MTSPFDPFDQLGPSDAAAPGEPGHLVLAGPAGRRSLWPRWLPVPPGWSTAYGPAPYDDCLHRLDAPPPRPASPDQVRTRDPRP
ncbi:MULTISPECIES: MbtH family NRPS accessory protein [unclassified Streptomyces]|uniref:MbtH family NRPS accessory protein n=1 Tax=unclassified Streptomyces TaxID=2593676 RepID=UPI0009A0BE59|nr:MbtH family NRPS accessory protein [Streptomyces sp. SAT1]